MTIRLERMPKGELREVGTDAYWTRTGYTSGACPDGSACDVDGCEMGHDVCIECSKDLPDTHYVCLDGGDAAHTECIEITEDN